MTGLSDLADPQRGPRRDDHARRDRSRPPPASAPARRYAITYHATTTDATRPTRKKRIPPKASCIGSPSDEPSARAYGKPCRRSRLREAMSPEFPGTRDSKRFGNAHAGNRRSTRQGAHVPRQTTERQEREAVRGPQGQGHVEGARCRIANSPKATSHGGRSRARAAAPSKAGRRPRGRPPGRQRTNGRRSVAGRDGRRERSPAAPGVQVRKWACAGNSSSPAEFTQGVDEEEVAMPVWAWVLIIVLLVLLLTGGVYVRR